MGDPNSGAMDHTVLSLIYPQSKGLYLPRMQDFLTQPFKRVEKFSAFKSHTVSDKYYEQTKMDAAIIQMNINFGNLLISNICDQDSESYKQFKEILMNQTNLLNSLLRDLGQLQSDVRAFVQAASVQEGNVDESSPPYQLALDFARLYHKQPKKKFKHLDTLEPQYADYFRKLLAEKPYWDQWLTPIINGAKGLVYTGASQLNADVEVIKYYGDVITSRDKQNSDYWAPTEIELDEIATLVDDEKLQKRYQELKNSKQIPEGVSYEFPVDATDTISGALNHKWEFKVSTIHCINFSGERYSSGLRYTSFFFCVVLQLQIRRYRNVLRF